MWFFSVTLFMELITCSNLFIATVIFVVPCNNEIKQQWGEDREHKLWQNEHQRERPSALPVEVKRKLKASSGRLRRCSFRHISVGFILQSRKLLQSVSCKIPTLKFMPLSSFIDRIQFYSLGLLFILNVQKHGVESEWEIGKEAIPAVKSFTPLWLLLVTSPDMNSNNVTTLW